MIAGSYPLKSHQDDSRFCLYFNTCSVGQCGTTPLYFYFPQDLVLYQS